MELSVRPGMCLAISDQLLPCCACSWNSATSSSRLQSALRMAGFRWLCQRSRHCLPVLPRNYLPLIPKELRSFATRALQLRSPNSSTSSLIASSSCVNFTSAVHGCRWGDAIYEYANYFAVFNCSSSLVTEWRLVLERERALDKVWSSVFRCLG